MASKWDPAVYGRAQLALDGRLGRDFIVTDYMGWRMHPVKKVRKHHNGTDICSKHPVAWIEAPYYGKVIFAADTNDGFGTYVQLYHQINGREFVTVYAHMERGSLKVKVGQRVKAGTILGKMGSTGMSTGRHLHWECVKGARYQWSATGQNFVEPIKFFSAIAAQEAALLKAAKPATDAEPTLVKPTDHSFEAGVKLQQAIDAAKAAGLKTTTSSGALAVDPNAAKPVALVESAEKTIQRLLAVKKFYTGSIDGKFGPASWKATQAFLAKHGLYGGAVDGIPGPRTFHGFEEYAKRSGHFNEPVDGVLSRGSWANFAQALIKETTPAPAPAPTVTATPAVAPVTPAPQPVPAVATTPAPASTPVVDEKVANPGYPGHYVQLGDTGVHVRYVQQQLNITPLDGVFGEATKTAVTAFQTSKGLDANGIVGEKTWAAIG